jgi:hypothetical protein
VNHDHREAKAKLLAVEVVAGVRDLMEVLIKEARQDVL